MLGKKETDVSSATTTVIGKDMTVNGGAISGAGSIRVDGQVVCEVTIGGQMILGETGSIEGNVKAQGILLAGKMRGNINCDGSLHIVPSGSLVGDIQVGQLVVEDGAKFDGTCKMTGSAPAQKNKGVINYGKDNGEDNGEDSGSV